MKRGGFTLIELLVATTIMVVAVAMACSLFITGMSLQHNVETLSDEEDAARFAMDDIMRNVQRAGLGASQGLLVSISGIPTLLGAVFGLDGTAGNGAYPSSGAAAVTGTCSGTASTVCGGTDDLWLLVPDWNAMEETCASNGAGTTIAATGTGVLQVECAPQVSNGDLMMATNMTTAALLSNVTVTAHTLPTLSTINYTESGVANYVDSQALGVFQQGDMAFRVNLVHYFVQSDSHGVPGLYKTTLGGLTSVTTDALYPTQGRPFFDSAHASLVQSNVENLQVVYGFDSTGAGNPAAYTWAHGLSPQFPKDPGASNGVSTLVSVRITVVARGRLHQSNTGDGNALLTADYAPLAVENYVPGTAPAAAATPDGYRRVPYTRVVDIPNLLPGNM